MTNTNTTHTNNDTTLSYYLTLINHYRTSTLPKPDIAQHVWQGSTEELMRYIDWHARHPGCVTPREFTKKTLDGMPILAENQMIDDDDPNKFYYTYSSVMKNGMAPLHHEAFEPPQLGKDGDLASVAEFTSKFEREQFDIMKRYYDDPWYVASVRDQLSSGYHADGYRTPSGNLSCPITYKDLEIKAQLTRARRHIVIKATPADFETAAIENKEQFAKFSIETSGTNVKTEELQRKALHKESPWGSPKNWSRHTKDGTALDKWKRKVLEDDIKKGLEEFEGTLQKLKKEKKASKKSLFGLPLPPLSMSLWKSPPKLENTPNDIEPQEIDNVADSANDNNTIISELTLQDFDESDNNVSVLLSDESSPPKAVRILPALTTTSNSPSTPSKVDLILSADSPSKKLAQVTPLDSPSISGRVLGSSKTSTPSSIQQNDIVVSQLAEDENFSSDEESTTKKKKLSKNEEIAAKFNEQMGGLEKVDKLADDWVNFAVDVRKKTKKNSNLFDMNMDICDACDRGSYARAFGILSLGGNPHAELDEVPIFTHIFQKCVNLDVQFDELMVGSANTTDREKFQKILDLLVMFNADVNSTKNKEGQAPIHIAAQAGDAKILNWLLKNRGSPDLYDKQGMTALMLAAKNGHMYAMAELLRGDAQINKREKDQHEPGNIKNIISKGRTALHFAASTGQTRACIFLIGCQADKKITDYDGISPALAASENGCEATAQQILTYARPVMTVDYQLNTMIALKKEQEDAANASLIGQLTGTTEKLGSLFSSMFGKKQDIKDTKETSDVVSFNDF